MSDQNRSEEDRFLNCLLTVWPKDKVDIALDVNAAMVGDQIGIDNEIMRRCVRSLVSDGKIHAREVGGVLLIHPTPAALLGSEVAQANGLKGLINRFFDKA